MLLPRWFLRWVVRVLSFCCTADRYSGWMSLDLHYAHVEKSARAADDGIRV